ncbi:MAG TPA: arginine--tRNA ligase [Dehalococcoidia bacterium]|nr:arginine--tRNA ligase [Dehalococcoidia bacterium]
MVRRKITRLLEEAVAEAQNQGLLPQVALPEVMLERPQGAGHGDYASNFPMKLARVAKSNPLSLAEKIVPLIRPIPELEKVEVARPGFINFTLRNDWLAQQVDAIRSERERFGSIDLGGGQKVQLEFVSVNPTGPLHVGHGRGAIMGDTLANVLSAAGYRVEKEYYVNDAGGQIGAFYRSLHARYREALGQPTEIPADGYHGRYVIDMAKGIIAEKGDRFLKMPEPEAVAEMGVIGLKKVMDLIRSDLELLGVCFDVWFSEKSLYDNGQYEKAISILRDKGHVVEREGAVWFASSELGEDKDNVLVRTTKVPTYFASDVAYHYNKFLERRFDRVINIWGADHQGHVARMKAVLGALGIDPAKLEIIITQLVMLKRGNVEVKISKRSGDLVTLRELVEEVGADACRFVFLSRSADSQMDFDIELAKKESAENPVYYVQYAHARISSIFRLAQEKGIDFSRGNVALLTTEAELDFIRKMLQLPEVVETVATKLEPHHLPYYAQDLATAFHSFYKQCRVVSDDAELTAARLKLVDAARIAFARTLSFMGMSVPERM